MKVRLQCPDCQASLRPATASRLEEKLVLRTCPGCGESFEIQVYRTSMFIASDDSGSIITSQPMYHDGPSKDLVSYSRLTRNYQVADGNEHLQTVVPPRFLAGAPRYQDPRKFVAVPDRSRRAEQGIEVRRECGSITWLSHGQLSTKLACAKNPRGHKRAHEACQVKPRQNARRRLRAEKYEFHDHANNATGWGHYNNGPYHLGLS